jgi:hypothetical protein
MGVDLAPSLSPGQQPQKKKEQQPLQEEGPPGLEQVRGMHMSNTTVCNNVHDDCKEISCGM